MVVCMVFAFSWTALKCETVFLLDVSLGSHLLLEKTEVTLAEEHDKRL